MRILEARDGPLPPRTHEVPDTRGRRTRALGFAADVLADASAILFVLQLPGVFIFTWLEGRIGIPVALSVSFLALFTVASVVVRCSGPAVAPPNRPVAVIMALVLLLVVSTYAVGAFTGRRDEMYFEASRDPSLWLYSPGETVWTSAQSEDNQRPKALINSFGLRGKAPRREDPGTRVVAVVGDSYIFGIGVGDGDTIEIRLEEKLDQMCSFPVEVANAAMPGVSFRTYADLAGYAKKNYDPDLIIVNAGANDLVPFDWNWRISKYTSSRAYRLFDASGYEILLDYPLVRMIDRGMIPGNRPRLTGWLERLRQRADGTAVMIVIDGVQDPFGQTILRWAEKHETVSIFDAGSVIGWRRVERIPDGAHWSAAGVVSIAAYLAPTVARHLEHLVSHGSRSP